MPLPNENVTIGVSHFGVFTIRQHPTIIHGCIQTRHSEQLSVKESATFANSRASAKKPLLTNVDLCGPTCHV